MLADYSPGDNEAVLTTEDIGLLKQKFRRGVGGWLAAAVIISIFVAAMSFPLTAYHWALGFLVWFGIGVMKFLRHRSQLEQGKKRIIRGAIAQRYKTESDESLDLVIYIDGKRFEVPTAVYRQYFTGDFVEFHYLDKVLLQHKLLKRGNKEYA
jgi:hypothetical protein